jgi:ribosomal protein L11 methyltransferase
MNDDGTKVWHLISVSLPPEMEDLARWLLFELGTNGIVTLSEGNHRVELGAYFDDRYDPEEITRELLAALEDRAQIFVSTSAFPDEDWVQRWKEGLEPIHIGDKLLVAPSWKVPQQAGDRLRIIIDPGMAFGTGSHETTRLCLLAIERHWRGGRFLDVGTGTGILAIAAALLAPGSRVVAIDIDPRSVEAARQNSAANGAPIEVLQADLGNMAPGVFDFVAANLTADAIIDLMGELAARLAPSGLMALSGIVAQQAEGVERAVQEAGLKLIERDELNEWIALVARANQD